MAIRAPRPRRTRIYGANYDIGESLYKKQLDNLDNKRISRFDKAVDLNLRDTISMPKVSFAEDFKDDKFFQTPTRNPNSKDEVASLYVEPTKHNVRAYTPMIFLSHEMDNVANTIKKDVGHKSCDLRSEVKRLFISEVENDVHEQFVPLHSKFSHKIDEDHEFNSSAANRMKATKTRLADLETEISSITEKQNERQKRNSRLKKLLSDVDAIES